MFRKLGYGLQNFWRFRKVIWRWRPWDYAYTYELFVTGLTFLANHIERHHNHTDWAVDVQNIRDAVRRYRIYEKGYTEEWLTGEMSTDQIILAEEARWREFHDLCKEKARGWWD